MLNNCFPLVTKTRQKLHKPILLHVHIWGFLITSLYDPAYGELSVKKLKFYVMLQSFYFVQWKIICHVTIVIPYTMYLYMFQTSALEFTCCISLVFLCIFMYCFRLATGPPDSTTITEPLPWNAASFSQLTCNSRSKACSRAVCPGSIRVKYVCEPSSKKRKMLNWCRLITDHVETNLFLKIPKINLCYKFCHNNPTLTRDETWKLCVMRNVTYCPQG